MAKAAKCPLCGRNHRTQTAFNKAHPWQYKWTRDGKKVKAGRQK